jgi:ABC-type glutathione transport system ATPase component
MALLQARDLWAGYGGPAVLAGVDLDLERGQRVGLLGASGVGKTTLVEILAGRLAPARGSVALDGRRVFKPARRDKKQLAARLRIVHQNGHGAAELQVTVQRAVQTALDEARAGGRSTGMDVAAALAPVGLPTWMLKRTVRTLSGGERQRLALAMALATRPEVLLLDEPLTALDPGMRNDLAAHIAQRAAEDKIALLLASHDVRLIEHLTDSVHVLAEGRLVEHGTLRDVLADPKHPDTKAFVEALPAATLRWS